MMLEQKANLLKEKHAEENSQLAQNSMLESSSPHSNTGKMKDKMNKLLQKPGGIPFWKKRYIRRNWLNMFQTNFSKRSLSLKNILSYREDFETLGIKKGC